MKRFDYETLMEKYNHGYKSSLIWFITLLIVFVLTFVLGIVFATYENRTLMMIVFSIALTVISFATLSVLILGVIENKKNQKQLYYILGSYMSGVNGEIIDIKDQITTISGRSGIEIIIKNDDNVSNIFYDPSFGEVPFKIGDHLNAKIGELFIIEYEVDNA